MEAADKNLSEQESLLLIQQMINKAKTSYHDTGIGSILWGVVVTVCSMVSYFAMILKKPDWFYIWFLTIVAILPQILINIKEKKAKKFVSLTDEINAAVWTTFGFSMFVLSTIDNLGNLQIHAAIYLLIYGFPTIITGWVTKFKLMTIGGILCWVFAIASVLVAYPYPFLFMAAAAIVAWLIPGIVLNQKFRKQKAAGV